MEEVKEQFKELIDGLSDPQLTRYLYYFCRRIAQKHDKDPERSDN